MYLAVLRDILIPFLGTSLGAACVFFMKGDMNRQVQRGLLGFASGVMVAASVWSLLIPAMEQSAGMGRLAFIPAVAGLWIGFGFLLILDKVTPHMHLNSEQAEGPETNLKKTTMLVLAVTLHNLPEGMAVGVVLAGFLTNSAEISAMAALTLSLGIAIQNFPEGAIISMPLKSNGMSRRESFLYGVLSGIVEPLGAALTLQLS